MSDLAAAPTTGAALLATGRWSGGYDVSRVVLRDQARRGAISVRVRDGLARRAEPGPAGPLVLEARSIGGDVVCEVWGPAATPAAAAAAALEACAAWAGLRDTPGDLVDVVAGQPRARALVRHLGEVRLSRLPRVGESLGRAVLAQLVQGSEAARSIVGVAACAGAPGPHGLWTWPTAAQLGAVPAWTLRRCGVSLKGAGALHAGAVHDARLTEAGDDWALLDRRLRTLPGVGLWTSAETRLALGDPDAVSVGDYHLPSIVGAVLGDPARSAYRTEWTDDDLLALLAPFPGQRGRVIRLCERAARSGLARRPPRRGARAALSAHRYW